jgi:hypothetical protein
VAIEHNIRKIAVRVEGSAGRVLGPCAKRITRAASI